ncbi:hypothetical protein DCCM_4828 [Desulfocucumis palustris]|uniref:Uncharacterized protein n=1 Tax=Desulfocucumis palustris TaxID=1898651 RepID=A0A2L2XH52_9FIRM|nr:hypothetical protein DCCM_4828 [Desulfocucumis palustris]
MCFCARSAAPEGQILFSGTFPRRIHWGDSFVEMIEARD